MTPSCEAEKEDQRYFNSPPHKKNHIATTMINTVFFKISTHILTKRMTDGFPTFCILCVISTHILTKRMTVSVQTPSPRILYFNSHPHEEDDDVSRLQPQTKEVISTHILTKRMTNSVSEPLAFCVFQLTSSRRGWQSVQRLEVPETDFNSHPHEEDDSPSSRQYQLREHFNSHPHEEDDISPTSGSFAKIPFQLTSSRRGWLNWCLYSNCYLHFNSHPHEEDDVTAADLSISPFSFQLTSSRRGWRHFAMEI